MAKYLFVVLVFTLCACSRFAYTGRVDEIRTVRSGMIIDLDGRYPTQKMTLFVPRQAYATFGGHWPPTGATVQVQGNVTQYHGRPEIVVHARDQLSWRER